MSKIISLGDERQKRLNRRLPVVAQIQLARLKQGDTVTTTSTEAQAHWLGMPKPPAASFGDVIQEDFFPEPSVLHPDSG